MRGRTARSVAMTRICYLHVGTHKTGTTSLQALLRANEDTLARRGIYVPRTGRPPGLAGHHNIAWQLNGDSRFDSRHGTVAELIDEIASRGAPVACVSSEAFEYLHDEPAKLRRLARALRSIGYEARVLIYLRPQAEYAESLYAELVKHGLATSFPQFLQAVLRDGAFAFRGNWLFRFEYGILLDALAKAFGREAVVARAYRGDRGVDFLLGDFLSIVSRGSLPADEVRPVERLNASMTFLEVVRTLAGNVGASRIASETFTEREIGDLDARFDPIHLRESMRIIHRFGRDNRRVRGRYGVSVPCVSKKDLLRDLAAALGFDPRSRRRRRLLRSSWSRP